MFDPIQIITAVGLVGIFAIVFAESGFFFGFFFPGDTLLFTAGLLASRGFLPIVILIIGCAFFAILGDTTGYWIGKRFGRKLFDNDASFFFKKKYLYEAEKFYDEHGKYTIILARFIPIIRTFAPVVAGMAKMHYQTFLSYNIWGGVMWSVGILSLGYFLGNIIPNIDAYLLPIIFLIIIISFIPPVLKIISYKKRKK